MNYTPQTFDLGALAERLASDPRYKALCGVIRRAIEVHSLHTDLVMAEESCAALASLLAKPTKEDDKHKIISEAALLCNAIVLYARATKTTSVGRRGLDLRRRFSDEQKKVHAELCDLRDDAIAHFGAGGSYDGVWKAEVAILDTIGSEFRIGVVARRLTIDRKLVGRVQAQVTLARSMVEEVYFQRIRLVTNAVIEAARADPNFGNLLLEHPINLDAFLHTSEAAAAARAAGKFHQGIVSH